VLGGRLDELNAFEGSLVAFALIAGLVIVGVLMDHRR
jgi:hypothetical protein